MALVGLEMQPPGWKPSGDWIVVLVIDLAILGAFKPRKASGKAIWLCFGFMEVFVNL